MAVTYLVVALPLYVDNKYYKTINTQLENFPCHLWIIFLLQDFPTVPHGPSSTGRFISSSEALKHDFTLTDIK